MFKVLRALVSSTLLSFKNLTTFLYSLAIIPCPGATIHQSRPKEKYYLTSLGHLRSCYTLAEKLNDQKSLKAFAYYGKYICFSIGIQPIPAEASLAKAVLIEALRDPYSRRDALRALAKVEATQISQDKKDKHFSGEYLNKLVKSRDPYFYNFVEKMKKNDAVRLYLDTIEQSRYNHRCVTTSSGNPTILVKKKY